MPMMSEESAIEEYDVDEILEKLQLGYFHYRMLFICGMAFMADAMEITLLSFISICAGSDWDLSNAEVASISSSVFCGILIGNIFWGPVADTLGRRNGFMLGSAMIVIFGVATGFAPNYIWLLIIRTLLGFGVGGSAIAFDLLAEFLPKSQRGQFLTNINYFWTLGSMFVAGCAWAMLSAYGWRLLAILTSVPVCISLVWAFFVMPESARWLVVKGRVEEAEMVLVAAAKCNNTVLPPFKLRPSPFVPRNNQAMSITTKDFFGRDMLPITVPLFTIWFLFGLTYYGIIFLVSRIYHKEGDDDGLVCDFDYANIFYNAASEVIGVALAALIIDRFGRLGSQTSLYGFAGCLFVLIGIKLSDDSLSVVSMLARILSMAATSITMVITPELFRTHLRATGHAIGSSFGKLGGFAAPFLVNSSQPVFVVALCLAIGNWVAAGAAYTLPETKYAALDEIMRRLESADETKKPLLSS